MKTRRHFQVKGFEIQNTSYVMSELRAVTVLIWSCLIFLHRLKHFQTDKMWIITTDLALRTSSSCWTSVMLCSTVRPMMDSSTISTCQVKIIICDKSDQIFSPEYLIFKHKQVRIIAVNLCLLGSKTLLYNESWDINGEPHYLVLHIVWGLDL